jgi:hypothetical protein
MNSEKLFLPSDLGEPLQQRIADRLRQLDQIPDPHCNLSLNLGRELLDPLQVSEDRSFVEQ